MATPRRLRFVHGVVAWQLAAVLALTLLGAMEPELFFVLSLVGFLVVVELTAPFNVTPEWRSRLKWLVAVGLAVFGYVVVRRVLEILPQSVVEALVPFVATVSPALAEVVP